MNRGTVMNNIIFLNNGSRGTCPAASSNNGIQYCFIQTKVNTKDLDVIRRRGRRNRGGSDRPFQHCVKGSYNALNLAIGPKIVRRRKVMPHLEWLCMVA